MCKKIHVLRRKRKRKYPEGGVTSSTVAHCKSPCDHHRPRFLFLQRQSLPFPHLFVSVSSFPSPASHPMLSPICILQRPEAYFFLSVVSDVRRALEKRGEDDKKHLGQTRSISQRDCKLTAAVSLCVWLPADQLPARFRGFMPLEGGSFEMELEQGPSWGTITSGQLPH